MKILMINSVCGIKSTGRICVDIARKLEEMGNEVKIAYGREYVPEQYEKYAVRIGTEKDVKIHGIKARLFDASGLGSTKSTKKFLEWVKEYDPDIIHLHNIHGYYINIKILFNYIKKSNKKIIWTLHDCWTFTGHCAYFDMVSCDKWKVECNNCTQKSQYPTSFLFDFSRKNYNLKKNFFCNIENLVIVTPSEWLKKLVKQSILKEYRVNTIYNGVNTAVFRYRKESDIVKAKYGIQNKKVILGVAAVWDQRKGLNEFIKLSRLIDKDKYSIILVGLSKKQINELPDSIIGIERTDSIDELAMVYSAAEVYFNPTFEDNYPTTNLEAISCGTPVITYDTGGSVESAKQYGAVVEKGNVERVYDIIENKEYAKLSPVVDNTVFINQYIKLYESVYYEKKENISGEL